MRARAAAVGGRVPGFWLRYAVEQVCLVGFIRRRLDVHRFDREKPGTDSDQYPSPACTSSLGFSCLYILMLWLIVTQVIVLHSYT